MSISHKDPPGCPSPPRAGGQVQVQFLLCKSCGLCAEYCPRGLLKQATDIPPDERPDAVMNPAGHVVYTVHDPQGKCNGCGICATVCPEGAIVVYRRRKEKTPGHRDAGTPGQSGAGELTSSPKEDDDA